MEKLIEINSYPVAKVLDLLLQDKTTKKNIIWATDTYSRESAAYIKDHPILYSMISDTEVHLKREALRKCSDEGVVKETEDIYYNFPELFGQAL